MVDGWKCDTHGRDVADIQFYVHCGYDGVIHNTQYTILNTQLLEYVEQDYSLLNLNNDAQYADNRKINNYSRLLS